MLRWRLGARGYTVALLTVPLMTTVMFLVLSWLLSPEFLPVTVSAEHKGSLVPLAIGPGLAGGLVEELGWTGFAVPRLRRLHSAVRTGLIVGLIWGAWHLLANVWWSGSNAGRLSLSVFLPPYFMIGVAQLAALRILMVWLYDWTESLLLATLMHASLIVSTVALVPATTGTAFLTWFFIFTVVLWAVVAAVIMSDAGRSSRNSPRRALLARH